MIDVKAESGVVRLTFPTEGMTVEQVNDFVSWLRLESIARRSNLAEKDAWQLSEEIKADWWGKNQQRFGE
jgi:hypothetical protein